MLDDDPTRTQWPPWYGFAALGIAVIGTLVGGGIVLGIVAAAIGVDSDAAGITIALTVIQDAALLASALYLAAQVRPPTPEQFGIRPVPFLRGLKWAAIAFAIYFPLAIAYTQAVKPDEQTTLRDLGAGSSVGLTILIGVLVVGLAPIAEEVFFRGFFYGALRTRFSFMAAALIDGAVFGVVHAGTGPQAIPPLIILGFAFCVAYEATGSILPGIVLHALNNMVAFGADKDGSWAVALVTASLVVLACVTLPGRSRTLN
jgi:uncharacterized protein